MRRRSALSPGRPASDQRSPAPSTNAPPSAVPVAIPSATEVPNHENASAIAQRGATSSMSPYTAATVGAIGKPGDEGEHAQARDRPRCLKQDERQAEHGDEAQESPAIVAAGKAARPEPADHAARRERRQRERGELARAVGLGERRHRELDGAEPDPDRERVDDERPQSRRLERSEQPAPGGRARSRRCASAASRTSLERSDQRRGSSVSRRRPGRGHQAASAPASSGPMMKMISWNAASSEYAVERSSSGMHLRPDRADARRDRRDHRTGGGCRETDAQRRRAGQRKRRRRRRSTSETRRHARSGREQARAGR